MEEELSALYLDEQGKLCINYGSMPMYVDGFGECIFGEYILYVPKKNQK